MNLFSIFLSLYIPLIFHYVFLQNELLISFLCFSLLNFFLSFISLSLPSIPPPFLISYGLYHWYHVAVMYHLSFVQIQGGQPFYLLYLESHFSYINSLLIWDCWSSLWAPVRGVFYPVFSVWACGGISVWSSVLSSMIL